MVYHIELAATPTETQKTVVEKLVCGDLQYLISFFGSWLDKGHTWDPRIPRKPRTIQSLLKAVNDSYAVCESHSGVKHFIRWVG